MIARLLNLLRHKRVRDIAGWLGGGLVVLGGGAWSVWTYYHPQPPPAVTAPAAATGKTPAGTAAASAPAPVAQPSAPAAAPLQQARASDSGMAVNRIGKGATPIGQSAEAGSGGIAVNVQGDSPVEIEDGTRRVKVPGMGKP